MGDKRLSEVIDYARNIEAYRIVEIVAGMGDCLIGFSSGFSQWDGAEIELDDPTTMWYNKRRSISGQL